MKTSFYLILFVLLTQLGFAQNAFNYKKDFKTILARTKNAKEPLYYHKLVKRFEHNDTTLTHSEVLALMIGFTAQPAYKPYQDLDTERAIYDLNGAGQYDKALQKANAFLKTHPLSVSALFEKSYAFLKKQQKDSSAYYAYRGTRILRAMRFSGDGQTPETASFALGPADGQDYILKYVGGKLGEMGSGTDADGHFLDILEVKPKDGSTGFKLYFIIQHATDTMFKKK